MGVGRGFTAVARQVPRLTGLVWLRVSWDRKDRHSATGLMARNKGQRGFVFMLAFFVAEIFKMLRSIQAALLDRIGIAPTAE